MEKFLKKRVALVSSFMLLTLVLLFFSLIELTVSAEDAAPSDSGQVVHAWKSKLVKPDKTLLEIVKEESQNIEVLPCLFFLPQLFHQYDVTFERYLPVYRLKEAAVLASYPEAAECLDQIDLLSGKEKACALFALSVYEARRRPRPQSETPASRQVGAPLPYFPYREFGETERFEAWTDGFEADGAIEPSYWEKWDRVFNESSNDSCPAFAKIASSREFYPHENGVNFKKAADELVDAWIRNIESCARLAEKYVGKHVNYDAFVTTYPHATIFAKMDYPNAPKDGDPSFASVPANRFGVLFLKGVENFDSEDPDEIQTAYALREYWIQLSFRTAELPRDIPNFCNVNTSFGAKTVGDIARELRALRGDFYQSEPSRNSDLPKELVLAWENKLCKPAKTLIEIIREESTNIETIPLAFFALGSERCYDLTFERYLPFYRLKEAAVLATYEEALQCLEQYDSFSNKEKALALTALVLYERKRRFPQESFKYHFTIRTYCARRIPFFPYYPLAERCPADVLTGGANPDESIPNEFWKKWSSLYQREKNNNATAFSSICSERRVYVKESDEANAQDETLLIQWRQSIERCAELAGKYVGKFVSVEEFLDSFDPQIMDDVKQSQLTRCFLPYQNYNPNTFGVQFLQSLDEFDSDDVNEIRTTYALREYWLFLNRYRELNEPDLSGINSSYSDMTVGDIARGLERMRKCVGHYSFDDFPLYYQKHQAQLIGIGM